MNKALIKRLLTAAILLAIVLPIIYFGGIYVRIFLAFVGVLVAYEVASLIDQKPRYFLMGIYAFSIWLLAFIPQQYFLVGMVVFLLFLFSYYFFVAKDFELDHLVYSFMIIFVVLLAMRSFLNIYDRGWGYLVILYVGFATFLCDTGAYFIGSKYGKTKLIPSVSPNKTVEGALGGFVCGALISLIFGFLFVNVLPKGLMIFASILLPITAEIGDLIFSSIKRRFGLKDFGSLLPGHGGFLDRVDSLIFTLMVFQAIVVLWGI